MFEVEVKFRVSHETIRAALADAGADPTERLVQIDTYYDAPHRDFAETDEALRIRQEKRHGAHDQQQSGDDATTKVTYKGPLVDDDSKTREEHETVVGHRDTAESIFGGLGFEPAAVVKKEREFFELDGYTVTLDHVEGLGEFVEIEAEADDNTDVERVRDGVFEIVRRLGLDPDEQIRTSYLGMLLEEEP